MNEKIIERSQQQVHGNASSYNISNVIVSNAISIIQSSNLITHTPKCWVLSRFVIWRVKKAHNSASPQKKHPKRPRPKASSHPQPSGHQHAPNRGGLRLESVYNIRVCKLFKHDLQSAGYYVPPLLCIVISCNIFLIFIICVSEWFWMVLVQTEFRLCPSDPFWHEHSSCFSARNPLKQVARSEPHGRYWI